MDTTPSNIPKLIPLPQVAGGASEAAAAAQYRELEADILARTIWGEARGEGKGGMEAVALVILNRLEVSQQKGGYWWGNTLLDICRKPYQFSCWNQDDPNYRKLITVNESDTSFATALRVARRALLGFVKDPTRNATHYHARSIQPFWAKGQSPSAVIGRHVFYRLVEE